MHAVCYKRYYGTGNAPPKPFFPAAPTTSRDPELNSSSIHRSTVPSFSYLLRHASVLRLLMDGVGSDELLLEALCSTP